MYRPLSYVQIESERESKNFLWCFPFILWLFSLVLRSFSLSLPLSLGVKNPNMGQRSRPLVLGVYRSLHGILSSTEHSSSQSLSVTRCSNSSRGHHVVLEQPVWKPETLITWQTGNHVICQPLFLLMEKLLSNETRKFSQGTYQLLAKW